MNPNDFNAGMESGMFLAWLCATSVILGMSVTLSEARFVLLPLGVAFAIILLVGTAIGVTW